MIDEVVEKVAEFYKELNGTRTENKYADENVTTVIDCAVKANVSSFFRSLCFVPDAYWHSASEAAAVLDAHTEIETGKNLRNINLLGEGLARLEQLGHFEVEADITYLVNHITNHPFRDRNGRLLALASGMMHQVGNYTGKIEAKTLAKILPYQKEGIDMSRCDGRHFSS
jgi:hypothetical protein